MNRIHTQKVDNNPHSMTSEVNTKILTEVKTVKNEMYKTIRQ